MEAYAAENALGTTASPKRRARLFQVVRPDAPISGEEVVEALGETGTSVALSAVLGSEGGPSRCLYG